MTSISQLPAEEILKAAEAERDRLAEIYEIDRKIFGTAQPALFRYEGAVYVINAIRAAMQDRS